MKSGQLIRKEYHNGFALSGEADSNGVGLHNGLEAPFLQSERLWSGIAGVYVTRVSIASKGRLPAIHTVFQGDGWQHALQDGYGCIYDMMTLPDQQQIVVATMEDGGERVLVWWDASGYMTILKEVSSKEKDLVILPSLRAVAAKSRGKSGETVVVTLYPLPTSPLLNTYIWLATNTQADALFNRRHRPTVALNAGKLTVSGKTANGDAVEFCVG